MIWSKIIGALVAALGIALVVWLVGFLTTYPVKPDLISPTLFGFPVIDWLVTAVLTVESLMAIIHGIAEGGSPAKNIAAMLPLIALNMVMVIIWWAMDLYGTTSLEVGVAMFAFTALVNAVSALLFLLRGFSLPKIEAA